MIWPFVRMLLELIVPFGMIPLGIGLMMASEGQATMKSAATGVLWWMVWPVIKVKYRLQLKLKRSDPDGDVIAFKNAFLGKTRQDNGYYFAPLRSEHPTYGVEAVAVHGRTKQSHNHLSECDCGFYALKRAAWLGRIPRSDVRGPKHTLRSAVLLEVELHGSIVVAEFGYRATKQTVMRVMVPRQCSECRRKAKYLTHTEKLGYLLSPVCSRHRLDYLPTYTPLEISQHLGTEVHWKK